jgi:hypothetical protein
MAKKKLTIWVESPTAEAIEQLATAQRLSVSQISAALLTKALQDHAESAGLDLLLPALQETIKKEVFRMSDRLANLMVRTALESSATRATLMYDLNERYEKPWMSDVKKTSWKQAVDELQRPVEGLRELLGGTYAHREDRSQG